MSFRTISTILLPGCEAGKYNDEEGRSSCLDCPAGYYCYANSTTFSPNICPKGHFCPINTPSPYKNPCKAGTYNPKLGANSSSDCLPCDGGKYCAGEGNEKPTNSCAPGWYCPGSNETPRPSGRRCQKGYFCPEGSFNMTKCTQGKYCDTEELSTPAGDCDPGYYCPLGSSSRREMSCPPGHYCPKGSYKFTPCDPGTYLPGQQHSNKSECLPCQAGKYCNISGLSQPQADCDAGYYCPPGQSTSSPAAYPCPAGHFCKTGSPVPSRCSNGTYQIAKYKSDCDECPEGYFCDNTASAVDTLVGRECPTGHFCLKGTKFSTEHKCPTGTWSNKTKLVRKEQCTDCPPRYVLFSFMF